jgi:hypothetical protein
MDGRGAFCARLHFHALPVAFITSNAFIARLESKEGMLHGSYVVLRGAIKDVSNEEVLLRVSIR